MGVAVIDRPQAAASQLLGQLVGIGQVVFVGVPALPAPIADDDARHQRGDQIVQPLRLGPFFESDVNRTTHAAKEFDERRGFRGHDRASDDASAFFPDRGDRACLMDVEPNILCSPFHESRSLLRVTGRG